MCTGMWKCSSKLKKSSLWTLKLYKSLSKDLESTVLESLQYVISLCQGDLMLASGIPKCVTDVNSFVWLKMILVVKY